MEDEQAIFVLTVRAEPGVDAIRALRAWLKRGLRDFGLRCVGITPNEEEMTMDARKYASKYVKPDNVRDGPIQTRIINCYEDERYARLTLELETGSTFGLNESNTNALISAWGVETNDWIQQEIVLELGTYKDWKCDPPEDKETVKVRAISPRKTTAGNSGEQSRPALPPSRTAAAKKGDMDDEIPF
jgi:hypothetical protein